MSNTAELLALKAAHIRHDLRTPLNAILGYSEMLVEDAEAAGDTAAMAALRGIWSAGEALMELTGRYADELVREHAGRAVTAAEILEASGKITAQVQSLKNSPFASQAGKDLESIQAAALKLEDQVRGFK